MPTPWSHVVRLFALIIALTSVSGSPSFAQQQFNQAMLAPETQAEASRAAQKPLTVAAPPSANQQLPGQASQPVKLNLQPGAGWSSKCESDSRQTAVECSVEQTVVVAGSGQLLASVIVRVPAATREPVMTIQTPMGLYLPAGLTLQVDDDKPLSLALQTCDLKGCYAQMPVSAEMISAMKTGKLFKVGLQNMAKENITIPLTLRNFAEAYQKIQ